MFGEANEKKIKGRGEKKGWKALHTMVSNKGSKARDHWGGWGGTKGGLARATQQNPRNQEPFPLSRLGP